MQRGDPAVLRSGGSATMTAVDTHGKRSYFRGGTSGSGIWSWSPVVNDKQHHQRKGGSSVNMSGSRDELKEPERRSVQEQKSGSRTDSVEKVFGEMKDGSRKDWFPSMDLCP